MQVATKLRDGISEAGMPTRT